VFWRWLAWLLAYIGPQYSELGDDKDVLPEPDGDDSVHKEAVDGLPS